MDELDPKLRALLDAARGAHDPNEQDARRVRSALELALGDVASHAAEQGQTSAPSEGSSLHAPGGSNPALPAVMHAGKWLGVLLAVGGLGTLVAIELGRGVPAAPRDTRPSPARVAAPRVEPLAPTRAPAPSPVVPAVTPESAAPETPPARAVARRSVKRAAGGAPPATLAAAPELPSELSLIGSATRALRDGRASEALRLLEEHAQVYPRGMLRQENQGLRVLALCALGHVDQGREERRRFLAAAPHAPLAGRVRAACTDGEQP